MKEINGTQLYFKSLGAGEPIIFLHGSGGSHRYFLPFVEELALTNELILYDRHGTGLSDGDVDMSAISIDQFVEDLEALRIALGFKTVSVVGHSWGAIIAIAYVIKYPNHLDGLILVNSIPLNNQYVIENFLTHINNGLKVKARGISKH